jgi:two-component system phosphate regulon sensor histidine kinase PhoR
MSRHCFARPLLLPFAQVYSLIVVNRGLAQSLRQLHHALRFADLNKDSATNFSDVGWVERDLSWKVQLLNQLQQELTSLYAFRQNLLVSMVEGLAVFARDGSILFRNPWWDRFCDQQRWSPELSLDEIGRRIGASEWSNVRDRLSQPGTHLENEVASDKALWHLRASPLESERGVATKWMVVATDITSSMERDRARAEALGFVTHELRTPLTSIQGFAEFLMNYPEAARGSSAAATIFRESRRLGALVNTYLDVLRMDAGHRPLRCQEVNVWELTSQVQKIMEPLADAAESRVTFHVEAQLPRLVGDANLLAGVLLNLLNNGVKYSPRGSEVRLHVTRAGDYIVFEVSNPSSPIPADDLKHLFEPYYRGREEKGLERGWGLGLAFVKRIVESHGGRVEATSDAVATILRVILAGANPRNVGPLDPPEFDRPATGCDGPMRG